jgi:hypothetical protein
VTGRFDKKLTLPAAGDITVRGPFAGDGDEDAAIVHFLIVQGEGQETVLATGQGSWKKGDQEWSGKVPVDAGRHPDGKHGAFRTDKIARGIGLAIALQPGKVDNGTFEPPAFQALTWCADFKFEAEQAAA